MKHNLRKRILVLATILTMLICVPTVNSCATEVPKEDPIQTIVQNMTLRQKIAQCLMMDFRKWNDAEGEAQNMTRLAPEVKTILEEYQFGAVILFAENIQKTGMDYYAPGHGMLVYRIDEGQGLDLGYVNKTALSPAVAIVAADSLFMPDWFGKQKKVTVTETGYTVDGFTGTLNIDTILVQKYKNSTLQYDSSTGTGNGKAIYDKEAAGDPWPGISNVTEMTGDSYYAFSTVKTFMQDKPVTEIKEEDGVITFKFMGGDVDGIINIDANDNTIDNRIADKRVYTIDGRLAGTSLEGLRPGIYIQNNKKIVVKQ